MSDLPLFDYARRHNQTTTPRAPARKIPGRVPFDQIPEDAKAILTLLHDRIGEQMGLTASAIAERLNLLPDRPRARRGDYVRRLINQYKLSVDWVIIADPANGFYRPSSAEELSHFMRSMHSRIREEFSHIRTVVTVATIEGWQRTGKHTWSSPADSEE